MRTHLPEVPGTTITVNTHIDKFGTGKDCSLREAITTANPTTDLGSDAGVDVRRRHHQPADDQEIRTINLIA
jgi:CSLREA domain-containing protein